MGRKLPRDSQAWLASQVMPQQNSGFDFTLSSDFYRLRTQSFV